jgi:uncharacterized protein (DUF1810 family)
MADAAGEGSVKSVTHNEEERYGLQRFVDAQEPVYAQVCGELRAGRKRTHWMWFVFPQMRGLGHSSMAERFGISSLEEAQACVAHPVLGVRLRECCRLLLQLDSGDAGTTFGFPDALKLRSSMTLFSRAAPDEPTFRGVLEKFFGGEEDAATLRLIAATD